MWEEANSDLEERDPDVEGAFVVLEFPAGDASQMTLGAPAQNWWQENSVFSMHIFYPHGTDAGQARGYADTLAAVFRGQQFDGVNCRAPSPPNPGESMKGAWQALTVTTPYYYRIQG